jgi:pyridoxine 5'-phosphate synthase PdxJ
LERQVLRFIRGPDERHIRYADVYALKEVLSTEFNIEGNPKEEKFVKLVLEVKPTQVTLVPDVSGQLTSDHGWDTVAEAAYLKQMIARFQDAGIRTSIFVDPDEKLVEAAALSELTALNCTQSPMPIIMHKIDPWRSSPLCSQPKKHMK